MNIQDALDYGTRTLVAEHVESPRLSTEVLLAHATGLSRAQVLASREELAPPVESQFLDLISRRARHEPVPYLTGEVEFFSIPLHITPGVLIPRPETETLVEAALAIARDLPDSPKIYDLCTGSGNIILALAMHLEDGEFWASDVSGLAIQLAAKNIRRYRLENRIRLREGPLFNPIRAELVRNFDLIVSNPPYVKSGDMNKLSPQVKDYEPRLALDGGREGMNFYQSILDHAAPLLKPGGYILLEADPTLMAPIQAAVQRKRVFTEFSILQDAAGKDRVCQFRLRVQGI
ncbi:MAG: peptide chain release factor N(5)-glutamine methyltransferase [bacterium]|jgi:release factor glutamine methyltransferase|nr:peptide chain release factor N(5)-glutamine methyltransferase [bacterium]